MRFILILAIALIAGCGSAPEQAVVSIYGDSITSGGNAEKIANGEFKILDYSVGGKHSDSPLDPSDYAPVVVLRYGMADAAHGLTAQQTRANLLRLIDQAHALGKQTIVVNVNKTPTCLECQVNTAISDITDIDVSQIDGVTLDGIHPDDAFYDKLNAAVRAGVKRIAGIR